MIRFPLGDGAMFVIIEPGNITRLKQGRPLQVGNSLVAFTPDINRFISLLLGKELNLPARGEPLEYHAVHLTPEQIDEALKACQSLPEVERP